MNDDHKKTTVKDHWERAGLGDDILAALREDGKDLKALTLADLAPLDQCHAGGQERSRRLAKLGALQPGQQVLDVGGGIGGPARMLALEFGCHVTVLDLTESYIQAGRLLNSLMHLDEHVSFVVGDALHPPWADHSFDVIWTQNSGMNIDDKERLYAEFHRLLRPKGLLVTQEPMAGPVQPARFPTMWSLDGTNHFLRSPEQMRAVIEAAGFHNLRWDDITFEEKVPPAVPPAKTVQELVMGPELLAEIIRQGQRNREEHRSIGIQAVFQRIG